jgi:hypothetical protein
MAGTLKALYIDDMTIGMINSDMGFIGDDSFFNRDKRFYLPETVRNGNVCSPVRSVGVILDPHAYDCISGKEEDVASAVSVVLNSRPYAAQRCTSRTYFAVDGVEYSLPLSRVDIGKLLAGERPRIRPKWVTRPHAWAA